MNKKQLILTSGSLLSLAAILGAFQHFRPAPLKAAAPICSERFLDTLLERDGGSIAVNCSFELNAKDIVRKTLVLNGSSASNLIIDCKGALIDVPEGKDAIIISSKRTEDNKGIASYARPENITIKNCKLHGSIRVYGMGTNGEATYVRESSRKDDLHTKRAQANAPRKILFDKLTIEGSERIPFYLSPGVTFVTLQNSRITGSTSSTAVYFDAESGRNTLRNNVIDADTDSRELIAIDGSAHNLIIGNKFSSLDNGGIYLYRNCGEGGTVRHQTPSYNTIIGNFFYYNKYSGGNPAVHVASRNGMRPYCFLDRGFPWGSSENNDDLARHNVIADNQIAKLSPDDMIEIDQSPNLVLNNRTVSSYEPKKLSCYDRVSAQLLMDGQSYFREARADNTCMKTPITCDNGVITEGAAVVCPPTLVKKFDCQLTGTNDACVKTIACPAGHKISRAKAACNLEYGAVSEKSLNSLPWNTLSVLVQSDVSDDGNCAIDKYETREGKISINLFGKKSVPIACKESDSNGGDCHVSAMLECVKL